MSAVRLHVGQAHAGITADLCEVSIALLEQTSAEAKEGGVTRVDALKKLRRVLGPKMTWHEDLNAPRGPEYRIVASAGLSGARERRARLREAMDARRDAILNADEEYQRLKGEAKGADYAVSNLIVAATRYRIRVGVIEHGIMNSIKAQGDNWADVVSKVCDDKAKVS